MFGYICDGGIVFTLSLCRLTATGRSRTRRPPPPHPEAITPTTRTDETNPRPWRLARRPENKSDDWRMMVTLLPNSSFIVCNIEPHSWNTSEGVYVNHFYKNVLIQFSAGRNRLRKSFIKSLLRKRLHLINCERIEIHCVNSSALIYAKNIFMDDLRRFVLLVIHRWGCSVVGASLSAFVWEEELNAKLVFSYMPSYFSL